MYHICLTFVSLESLIFHDNRKTEHINICKSLNPMANLQSYLVNMHTFVTHEFSVRVSTKRHFNLIAVIVFILNDAPVRYAFHVYKSIFCPSIM